MYHLNQDRVRELRERKIMSLSEASDAAGSANRNWWGQLEVRKDTTAFNLKTLSRICEVLDCKIEDILEYRDEPLPPLMSERWGKGDNRENF